MKSVACDGWKRLIVRYKYILLAILAGILILMLPDGDAGTKEATTQETSFAGDELGIQERRMESLLSRIKNAGHVRVMLTLRESRKRILAYDRKLNGDQNQYDTVVVSRGAGVQQPVVLQETGPTYQGAVVVCEGGDDPRVKLEIMNAVRSLTGLSADRICICKSK